MITSVNEPLLAAAEEALRAWDVKPSQIELVSQSENIVFRVTTATGEPLVLRLHRPGYHTLPELISEQQWTTALNQAGVDAPVPRLTRTGEGYTQVWLPHSGEVRYAGLLEWVDGTVLSDLMQQEDEDALLAHFVQVGRMAARIHNQADAWTPPPGFRRHHLDADGLMGETPFWGRFWDLPQLTPEERRQLQWARQMIHRQLEAYGTAGDVYGLIHADLHPGNLIVAGDRVHVIDFDDSGFGWRQYELAVALFYYQEHPLLPEITEALIQGYRSLRTLDDRDLDWLPLFLLIRCLALLGWIHQRPELKNEHRVPGLMARAKEQMKALL